MIDPAFGAFPVANAAPVLELGGDLHRHAGTRIDPAHVLVAVRTAAHIDLVGLETDEARHRQAADRAGGEFTRRARGRGRRGHYHSRPTRAERQDAPTAP